MADTFAQLNVAEDLCSQLAAEGITAPTAVQAAALPEALAGRDVIIRSHTGTGKTLCYLLPILQKLDAASSHLQAVVVAPTQELAMQIVRLAEKLGEARGIRTLGLIGGASLKRQLERLKQRPHLVAGTPGRLVELLEMRKLKLHEVRILVVDEVDQVFQLGEQSEIELIMKRTQRDRQLIFVSATMPDDLRKVADEWMTQPSYVDEAGEAQTAPGIEHVYFECEARKRVDLLQKLIYHYRPQASIVFVNHTDQIAEITEKLKYNQIAADALYGDQPKLERNLVLDKLRAGKLQVLVATDLAARGLDLPNVSHVFALHPAADSDYYVHRAGRTGRMGRKGTMVSLIIPSELFILRKFEKQLNIQIKRKELYFGRIVDPEKKEKMRATNVRSTSALSGKGNAHLRKKKSRDSKNKGAPRWLKEKDRDSK